MFDFPSAPLLNQVVTVAGRSYIWNGTGWTLKPVSNLHGQCRLGLEGSVIVLRPYDGRRLFINGSAEIVPDTGVMLGPSGTINTINYIYAFMTGGTMTLEISTVSPGRDSVTGVQIKTSDPTRSLVGMAYPISGPAFVASGQRALVRTWFNDSGVAASTFLPGQISTTSTTPIQLQASYWVEALLWRGETYSAEHSGSVYSTSGMQQTQLQVNGVASSAVSVNNYVNWTPFSQSIISGMPAAVDTFLRVVPYGFTSAGTASWHYSVAQGGAGLDVITGGVS